MAAESAASALIEVFANEPIGAISPNIYGHFTEHIGGVIYDGVWVGENSRIPNVHGIRKTLVDRLREIHAPVIRWPGGCFADSYDWKDGIGPRSERPTRTNFWEVTPDAKRLQEKGPQIFEDNAFGTDEFMTFCRLCNAEPYLAANLRSLPALDFSHWVEYCNSPRGSTRLAKMREAGGFPEPFNVRYWGVGNESWGCGGNFLPQDYASEFRRFTTWVPEFGQDLAFIAAGPNGDDVEWTRRFFEQIYAAGHTNNNPHFGGWSIHHYARVKGGDALHFDTENWYDLLRSADRMEQILLDHWAAIGEYDREHKVKLVVDEYGPWYREGTEADPTHIFGQQITIRDAIATALTLDTFNRNCDKVMMANCAQLINNINALFLAHEDKFLTTPNFHVFAMYAAHQAGQAIRTVFSAPSVSSGESAANTSFWGLRGSASLNGKVLTITATNPSTVTPLEVQIDLRGARASSATGKVLASRDLHDHNTFDQPDTVSPKPMILQATARGLSVHLPAASVTQIQATLV